MSTALRTVPCTTFIIVSSFFDGQVVCLTDCLLKTTRLICCRVDRCQKLFPVVSPVEKTPRADIKRPLFTLISIGGLNSSTDLCGEDRLIVQMSSLSVVSICAWGEDGIVTMLLVLLLDILTLGEEMDSNLVICYRTK